MNELPSNAPVRLHNSTCVYCGIALTPDVCTKEHVIGRRFVPKGKLQGNWNLIVNACKPCNRRKSDLEDDISAVSLQSDAWGRFGHGDEEAILEATRKGARSKSRRTDRPVKDSHEERTVKIPFGRSVNITIGFTSPPQVDDCRLFELAHFHLVGFFYLITFDEIHQRGGYWPGGFYPLLASPRSDWGNPLNLAFMKTVIQWEPRLFGCTAGGFHKIAIRRHPDEDCWSWALEWNRNYRLVGLFGDERAARETVSTFSRIRPHALGEGTGVTVQSPTVV